jgi:hypothetical protein
MSHPRPPRERIAPQHGRTRQFSNNPQVNWSSLQHQSSHRGMAQRAAIEGKMPSFDRSAVYRLLTIIAYRGRVAKLGPYFPGGLGPSLPGPFPNNG